MVNASHRAWELVSRKMKYAVKSLSESSVEHSYLTVAHSLDLLSFSFDFTLTDTLYSALITSVLLGIPFSDIVPATLDFRIELPTPEEFTRGLLIEIEPINLADLFPELLTISSLAFSVFETDAASSIIGTQLRKGIYGVERYGSSYYDPPGIAEFLRSTMFALTKKRSTDETVRARFAAAASVLNVRNELAETLFNSMQMVYYSKIYAACFDYAWFDVTLFPREGSAPRLVFVGWDLTPAEAESTSLVDAAGCCFFDSCFFDMNVVAADEAPTVYITERGGMLLTEVAAHMLMSARSRLLATPLAVANYQTAAERLNPSSSLRLESYAVSANIADSVRRAVAKALEGRITSSFTANLYAAAALDLIKRVTRPGGWGDELFRVWSYDELKRYFTERWSGQGLDPELLSLVFDAIVGQGFTGAYKDIRGEVKSAVQSSRR